MTDEQRRLATQLVEMADAWFRNELHVDMPMTRHRGLERDDQVDGEEGRI